ncbi:MAG TPA: BON domain-containing protein [Nannocystaceae bacterium]|nr:BON domain-containing protein [Nannocystaceae bacterium]
MPYLRFEDDDASVAGTVTSVLLGAVAGFAVGMLVAQRVGGFSGLADAVRRRGRRSEEAEESGPAVADDFGEFDDDEYDELEDEGVPNEGLEERVLEAFRNDPILSERAIDIGGIGEDTIELAGWVNSADEADHAVVLARGVPGVATVVNRIAVGDEEHRARNHARRFEEGDDALTEARWEGRTVGTGRRRQGTSDEPDRHSDPRVELEERWSAAEVEVEQAADDTTGLAERRASTKRAPKGDRTGGSPVAPTGVPKGDHVADPNASA